MQSSGTGLKLKRVAFFLAVIITAGMPVFNSVIHAEFTINGGVFAASGAAGTAITENSFAGMKAYRLEVVGEIGRQTGGPNGACPEKILPANGAGLPALYSSEIQLIDQWSDAPQQGQTGVVLAQTYNGQFPGCVWNGASYVGAVKKVITSADILGTGATFPDLRLQQVPNPVSSTVNFFDATLTWTGIPQDQYNLISSYTVFRSLTSNGTYTAISYTAAQVQGGTVSFTDTGLTAATTYYYKIAVNFEWDNSGNPLAPYLVSDAQSNTTSVTTKTINTVDLVYFLRVVPTATITVSTGQLFKVVAEADNNSAVQMLNVTPSLLTINGTAGSVVLFDGPSPVNYPTIDSPDRKNFTWTYSANAAGVLTLTGSVTATDSSGTFYQGVPKSSFQITVKSAASLASQVSAQPVTASVGQLITVVMSVTNSGQSDSNSTAPSITIIGSSILTPVATPASGVVVPGSGGSHQFIWTYSAGGPGTVYFSTTASGLDQYSSAPVTSISAPSHSVIVQTPANLSSQLIAPVLVSSGQVFTVQLVVTNSGQAAADNVYPLVVTNSASAAFNQTFPSTFTMPGNSVHVFQWTYLGGASSTSVIFSALAEGVDDNSGLAANSFWNTQTVTVQSRPVLTAAFSASPLQASTTQMITVILTITNTGDATADSIMPNPSLPGQSNLFTTNISGPSPTITSLLGHTTTAFTWVYRANQPGTDIYTSSVTAVDDNEKTHVVNSNTGSVTVNIQGAANLNSYLAAFPGKISTGQTLTVTLTVSNTGAAGANNIVPQLFTAGPGSATLSLLASPSPGSFSLSGNTFNTFTWTYSATGHGSINFQARADGQDANGLFVVSSFPNPVTVLAQNSSALVSSITSSPSNVPTSAVRSEE